MSSKKYRRQNCREFEEKYRRQNCREFDDNSVNDDDDRGVSVKGVSVNPGSYYSSSDNNSDNNSYSSQGHSNSSSRENFSYSSSRSVSVLTEMNSGFSEMYSRNYLKNTMKPGAYACFKVGFCLSGLFVVLMQLVLFWAWGATILQFCFPTLIMPGETLLPIHYWFDYEEQSAMAGFAKSKTHWASLTHTHPKLKAIEDRKDTLHKAMFHVVAHKKEPWLDLTFEGRYQLPGDSSSSNSINESTVDEVFEQAKKHFEAKDENHPRLAKLQARKDGIDRRASQLEIVEQDGLIRSENDLVSEAKDENDLLNEAKDENVEEPKEENNTTADDDKTTTADDDKTTTTAEDDKTASPKKIKQTIAPKNCGHFFQYVADNYDHLPKHVAYVDGANESWQHRGMLFQGMRARLLEVQRHLHDVYKVDDMLLKGNEENNNLEVPRDGVARVPGFFGLNNLPIKDKYELCDKEFLDKHKTYTDMVHAGLKHDIDYERVKHWDIRVLEYMRQLEKKLGLIKDMQGKADFDKQKQCPKELVLSGDFGSQFVVSAERLHLRNREFYETMAKRAFESDDVCTFWKSKWHVLFGDELHNTEHPEYRKRHPVLSRAFSSETEKGHLTVQLMSVLDLNYKNAHIETLMYLVLFVFARLVESAIGLTLIVSLFCSSRKLLKAKRSNAMVYMFGVFMTLAVVHVFFDVKTVTHQVSKSFNNEYDGNTPWYALCGFLAMHLIISLITCVLVVIYFLVSSGAKRAHRRESNYDSRFSSFYGTTDASESDNLLSSGVRKHYDSIAYTSSSGEEQEQCVSGGSTGVVHGVQL